MDLQYLVGKKIRVIKTDGFHKTGTVVSVDASFLILKFNDGSTEYIAIPSIDSISVDGE